MNKERELLKKCLDILTLEGYQHTIHDIKDLLAQPEQTEQEQEPVAWMYDWNIIEEEEYGETRYDCLTRADSITKSRAITNVRPLYKSPPKRESVSDDEIYRGFQLSEITDISLRSFVIGVNFAEKEHGIGE